MNFRQRFEAWHKAKYGYICKGAGTALSFIYENNLVQARWEAWQGCELSRESREFAA